MTQPSSNYSRLHSERRRNNLNRVDDMSAKDTTAHGRTIVEGLGEILVDIVFPVHFSNKPIFTYGSDLDDKPPQPVQTGLFPSLQAAVVEWSTVNGVEGAFDGYYVGCKVAVVAHGASNNQRLGFNWAFRERAIRNPVQDTS